MSEQWTSSDSDIRQGGERLNSPWNNERRRTLRLLWRKHKGKKLKIARLMGMTIGQIDGQSRKLGLQYHHGGKTWFKPVSPTSDAAIYGTTQHRSRVFAPDDNVLKDGDNDRKLGGRVTKGKWKGMPIVSLTLEERATCPRSCRMWRSCYGNSMARAKRYAHGLALELQIWRELHGLQRRYPGGFVVRLHVLGDMYSVGYVELWEAALDHFPALHVFGYTAWPTTTPIGRRVEDLREARWDRFAVRTSGAHTGPRTTVISRKRCAPAKSIICPAQWNPAGKNVHCGACGICWSDAARNASICFLKH